MRFVVYGETQERAAEKIETRLQGTAKLHLEQKGKVAPEYVVSPVVDIVEDAASANA